MSAVIEMEHELQINAVAELLCKGFGKRVSVSQCADGTAVVTYQDRGGLEYLGQKRVMPDGEVIDLLEVVAA